MEVIVAKSRGFCYGVKRAVDMVQACNHNNENTYTLGPIIHNPQVVSKFAQQGIGVINTLSDIEFGTVVIRSHGVGPSVYAEAAAKNINVVDATCPHVKKAQQAAFELNRDGYTVVIVGEKKHPEVKSILEWSGNTAKVIESAEEAKELPHINKLGVVAQTTFAGHEFQEITNVLKEKSNTILINRTICDATEQRQHAAVQLASKVDIMIVIGGKNSANTTRLADLCRQTGCTTYHIETSEELDLNWFYGSNAIGITAGASTPDWLIEEVCNKMEQFEQLVTEQGMSDIEIGSIVQGKVIRIHTDEVFIDIGYKSEGVIPLRELAFPQPEQASDVVKEGDIFSVYVMAINSEDGLTLSKVKAEQVHAWDNLSKSLENQNAIECKVIEAVKGGLAVAVMGMRGFIPASQLDLSYVEDLNQYTGTILKAVPIEIDKEKNRLVLSRKLLLQQERSLLEQKLFSQIAVNQTIKGTVKRIVEFGVFVDIGGIDGLVHISDLSWERVKNPRDVVNIGDEVTAIITKVDPKAKKISLSLKQVERDPWFERVECFSEGMTVQAHITKLTQFGAFAELQQGLEGLIRLSELAEQRVAKADEVVQVGQQVPVKILEIHKDTKRIALSIVQAKQDAERLEYQDYLKTQPSMGITLGDKFGHLFKHED